MAATRFLTSDIIIPYPSTKAYSRHHPSINTNVKYNDIVSRQPNVVLRGEYRGATNCLSSRSLFLNPLTKPNNKSPLVVFGSSNRSDADTEAEEKYKIGRSKSSKIVKKWADKQCIPVGVVCFSLFVGFKVFVMAFLIKVVQERLVPVKRSDLELVLAACGGLQPLISSLMKSPLSFGYNYGVLVVSIEIIENFFRRLKGDNSYVLMREMAAGLGGGVVFYLVAGVRCPITIIIGSVVTALFNSCTELIEEFSYDDENEDFSYDDENED